MSRLPSLNYDSSINLNQIALKFGTDKVDINHTNKVSLVSSGNYMGRS